MSPQKSFSQTALSIAILASTIGTYIALSPPNIRSRSSSAATHDSLSALGLHRSTELILSPVFALSIHTALLIWYSPSIPKLLLGHGTTNGFNFQLLTWNASTAIPLAFIFFLGIPLRLVPYATLNRDFTFFLKSPEHIVTDGIYAFVQHPSYVGLLVLVIANVTLLGRTDGIVKCWFSPRAYPYLRWAVHWIILPVGLGALLTAVWVRVVEEETMLGAAFGREWTEWHERTARFIPGIS